MGMTENNIEWGARGEIEFNIKSNLNKKLLFRQAVLYTFGQDCISIVTYSIIIITISYNLMQAKLIFKTLVNQ